MPEREILRTEAFERSLRRLARRYPDLPDMITQALRKYAIDGPSSMRYRQQGVGGRPIFKERLTLRGTGKRGGARLVVYCDDERVVALFVYVKSATELIPEKAIRKALEESGIGT